MVNFSTLGSRRISWTFGIGYGDDVDKAKKIVLDILTSNDKIKNDPTPSVAVQALNSSSVDLVAMAWVDSANYWSVLFEINELVYKAFNKEGVNIPFPQMDVHVIK